MKYDKVAYCDTKMYLIKIHRYILNYVFMFKDKESGVYSLIEIAWCYTSTYTVFNLIGEGGGGHWGERAGFGSCTLACFLNK